MSKQLIVNNCSHCGSMGKVKPEMNDCYNCKWCAGKCDGGSPNSVKCKSKSVMDYCLQMGGFYLPIKGEDFVRIGANTCCVGEFGCSFEPITIVNDDKPRSNQGREHCYICGIKTVKVDTGMFSTYDICPKCKV